MKTASTLSPSLISYDSYFPHFFLISPFLILLPTVSSCLLPPIFLLHFGLKLFASPSLPWHLCPLRRSFGKYKKIYKCVRQLHAQLLDSNPTRNSSKKFIGPKLKSASVQSGTLLSGTKQLLIYN